MNNTYGIVKPSLVNIATDVEIWYHYKPTRNSIDPSFPSFKKYANPSSLLTIANCETELSDKTLPGMYNLSLPVSIFGKVGFYTLYIKPSEIMCTIKDIGALSAFPDIKGIVIENSDLESNISNDDLVGYRIEYFAIENNGVSKRENINRIITSNNKCEVITQNLVTANVKSNAYRFNDSGSLMFLTVTPSIAPSFKSNATPYIGTAGQKIALTNTKFDPLMIEIEICEHDIETLSIMAEGEQIRNLENGRISTYNFNGEIYKQYEYSTIKNNYNQNNIIEAKINKNDSIDFSIDLDEIKNV